jgi:hypothetical protein
MEILLALFYWCTLRQKWEQCCAATIRLQRRAGVPHQVSLACVYPRLHIINDISIK